MQVPVWFLNQLEGSIEQAHKEQVQRILGNPNVKRDEASLLAAEERLRDAKKVICQSKQKFELYMAHKVRAAQQTDEFAEIDEQLQKEVLDNPLFGGDKFVNGTTMMLVIDWKMKFENKAKSEGSNEHYGKRGISWHGVFGHGRSFPYCIGE